MAEERNGWNPDLRGNIYESRAFWISVFALIFFLSIDFWNWTDDRLIAGFLPIWILRIIILQWILSFLFFVFYRTYGRKEG